MRKICLIGSLLLAAVLLWACQREDLGDERKAHISVAIEFPQPLATKADAYLEAQEDENAIHSLCIWVFRETGENDGTLLENAPLKVNASEFPLDGGVKEYDISVDWEFALNPPRLSVYVLANAESIGLDLSSPQNYSMQDLDNAVFGHDGAQDYFGITSLTRAVPATGLPMSAVGKHLEPSGSAPRLKVESLTLQRMVSRIRMVFCKTPAEVQQGETPPDIAINEVVFSGRTIPKLEKLFTEGETGVHYSDLTITDNNYESEALTVPWGGAGELCTNALPERLVYVNQDPAEYEAALQRAIDDGTLTDLGYVYLRETDRKLRGRVRYSVDGESRFREFVMNEEGDFARNHTWTLFAYFLSGRNLQIRLVVMPWEKIVKNIRFDELSVNVTEPLKFEEGTVDQDPNAKKNLTLIPSVVAHFWLRITTPVGGTLYVKPVGASKYFIVSTNIDPDNPQNTISIDPTKNGGKVDIYIRPSEEDMHQDDVGTIESTITLSFSVEVGDRFIDANSEAIDDNYRIFRIQ